MALYGSLRQRVEKFLYQRGFSSPIVRHLLTTQIIIIGIAAVVALALFWLTLWPFSFAAGAAIAGFSLWHISRFAQSAIQMQYSPALAVGLFVGFSARLVLIGVVVFALVVWLRAPLAPLLIGLGSTVAGIIVWGLSRQSRKTVKEA